MKLVHPDWEFQIVLMENTINTIVIENPVLLYKYIKELQSQCVKDDGAFVLSEHNEPIEIEKYCWVITDLFSIDLNQKSIISELQKRLKLFASNADNYLATSRIREAVSQYITELCDMIDFPVEFDQIIDIGQLIKVANIRLLDEKESFLQLLTDYIMLLQEFCSKSVFIIVNLKCFLTEYDLLKLYEWSCYQKLSLILFENQERRRLNACERIFIIDQDGCEIFAE